MSVFQLCVRKRLLRATSFAESDQRPLQRLGRNAGAMQWVRVSAAVHEFLCPPLGALLVRGRLPVEDPLAGASNLSKVGEESSPQPK
jgi:hypothetical protein